MDNGELKEKLRTVIPFESGGSFKLLWDMLYHIRLLKYVRQSQLKLINSRYSKVCSVDKLDYIASLSLLGNVFQDVYCATDNILKLLESEGYNINLLPSESTGFGDPNQINNTAVFIQALKLPNFKALLYPRFPLDRPYVIPDALLVLAEQDRYKLVFLEVEASKANWDKWIDQKRLNYLQLAKDDIVFSYWKKQCKLLDFPPLDKNHFKFTVTIVGKTKRDFETGFNFMERLDV